MIAAPKRTLNGEVSDKVQNNALPGGLEPPTFRLTAERANQLRHGSHTLEDVMEHFEVN